MEYDIGEKVILRNDLQVGAMYDSVRFTREMELLSGKMVEVLGKTPIHRPFNYIYSIEGGLFISKLMINHEKTAELNEENYAIYIEEQIKDPGYQELLEDLGRQLREVNTVKRK